VVVNAAHKRAAAAAAEKRVTIAIHSSAVPVVVRGDESRLADVVWHLLTNAMRFSDPGSEITVVVEGVGDSATIRVADQGSGIADEDLPRVFEPFAQGHTRTKRTGLGLGLAIARALVRLHGGTISAHSAGTGRGAIFRVSLPRLNTRSDSPATTKR
jgi:two-component system CheB/CheR fusion protein